MIKVSVDRLAPLAKAISIFGNFPNRDGTFSAGKYSS